MQWHSIANATDTITAISSPPGAALRGIVRVCGDDAFRVVNHRLVGAAILPRRGVQIARLSTTIAKEWVEVPVLMLVMPAPHSFTAQDTVEILVAGNPSLLHAVVDSMCDAGRGKPNARRATPGEFSARAFLNGTIGLDEAESIALSIRAESDAQLDAARQLRKCRVSQIASKAAEDVTGLLALVEAGIDFSDQEDVVAIEAGDLARALADTQRDLAAATDGTVPEESLRALPVIALRGATNAGKSSLFNALLGRERVVASPHAGSTRDAIVEPLKLCRGREVLIVDLPGIEDPQGALSQQMQDLAHTSLADATLQLHCVPLAESGSQSSSAGVSKDANAQCINVWTKSDCADERSRVEGRARGGVVTSAVTGEGLDELREALTAAVDANGWIGGARVAPVLLARHRDAIAHAQERIGTARELAQVCANAGERSAEPAEVIASDLRGALDALGTVAGRRTPDDVLAALFAKFCVGK